MEKIIELLNDYIPEWWSIEHWGKSIFYEWVNYNDRIIWKDFWFIKRLVENNKIKEEELTWFLYWPDYISDLSNAIIAWLSISETPIEDLIWLLK